MDLIKGGKEIVFVWVPGHVGIRGHAAADCKLDHLVRFETFIRNAFVKKEHVLTIFFDLEKRGSTAFRRTSEISVSGATSPGLSRASCLNAASRLEWVALCLNCTSRRWGSRKR